MKTPTNRDVNAATRAVMAMQLRAQRLTYDEIAKRCGYANPGACRKAILRELHRVVVVNVDALRREELAMLDQLHAAVWPLAVPPEDDDRAEEDDEDEASTGKRRKKRRYVDLFAVDRILAISDRRRALLGLDTPVNNNVNMAQVVVRYAPPGYFGDVEEGEG